MCIFRSVHVAHPSIPFGLQYMIRTMADPSSLWLMRKHFALQTASTVFLSYIACLSNRNPNRFNFSLKTGLMYMSEILPSKSSLFMEGAGRALHWSFSTDPCLRYIALDNTRPDHRCPEKVPFRLTPNMQHFITPAGVEGLLTSGVMAIARSLSQPEFDLESTLSLFLRDEVRHMLRSSNPCGLVSPQKLDRCRYPCGSRCMENRVTTLFLC